MAKDPVCGMNMDETKATSVTHDGETNSFCLAGCKATFDKAPSRYIGK